MKSVFLFFCLISSTIFASIEPQIIFNNNESQLSKQSKIVRHFPVKPRVKVVHKSSQIFPTQVIRLAGTLEAYNVSCMDVFDHMDELFESIYYLEDINFGGFGAGCAYWDGENASEFSVWISFDPLSEQSLHAVQEFMVQMKDVDFYGQAIELEQVSEIVTPIKLVAGNFIPPRDQSIDKLMTLTNDIVFDSYSLIETELFEKLDSSLFSNELDLRKAFLKKWFYVNDTDDYYTDILNQSNYIAFTAKPIFIFKKEPRAVTPFGLFNVCSKTKKGVCKSIPPFEDTVAAARVSSNATAIK